LSLIKQRDIKEPTCLALSASYLLRRWDPGPAFADNLDQGIKTDTGSSFSWQGGTFGPKGETGRDSERQPSQCLKLTQREPQKATPTPNLKSEISAPMHALGLDPTIVT